MAVKVNKAFLKSAFMDFEASSRKLEMQYARLGDKLGDLEREFSGKNRAAERTARLAAMGEMAAKIAHEIRNPLGSMLIFSTILCRELDGQSRTQTLAGHIVEGIRNLDRILSDMLVFSNQPEPSLAPITIREVIDDALTTCSGRKAVNITIENASEESVMVMGDARLLKQLFVNLIFNAFDAIGDNRGAINISTALREGQDLEVIVRDSGCGMDEETQDRIFEPFYTTRHSGTGLGLAIVSSIVKAHGGEIECLSSKGRGTRFILHLPYYDRGRAA